jgi:hypothetical protein
MVKKFRNSEIRPSKIESNRRAFLIAPTKDITGHHPFSIGTIKAERAERLFFHRLAEDEAGMWLSEYQNGRNKWRVIHRRKQRQ